jgi:hypothetical protein
VIRPLPLLIAIALLLVARMVARVTDAQLARRNATLYVVALLVLLAALQGFAHWFPPAASANDMGLVLEWVSNDWHLTSPFVNLLVALLAIAMAPVQSHRPRTLGVILTVVALAIAFVSTDQPIVLTVLWAASIAVVGRELTRLNPGDSLCARAFRRYQTISVIALALGTIALAAGYPMVGAGAWLLAIAVREASMPLHGWLPLVAERAPLGLFVAFVAPQTGVYAQLTVCGELSGGSLAHVFAAVGAFTGILAAGLGVVQTSARRAAAWLVISQTGLIAFGLENTSEVGKAGAVLSWQVMALATSGFVMTIAALEARRGELSLRRPGGSFSRTPRMAVAFLLLGFASVALPLTLGFVAEDLLIQGSVDEYPLVGVAVILATALNGINVMRCFSILFSGTRSHAGEQDLTRMEASAVTTILAVLLLGGLWPRAFMISSTVHDPSNETQQHEH